MCRVLAHIYLFSQSRIFILNQKKAYHTCTPRGWTWHIYRQGSAEYILGFEFRESVFLEYWPQLLYFKVFHIFISIFWVQFYSTGASIIMGLHYYHIMLDFCKMNSVFRVFLRGLCFGKYFFGFSVSGKVFFGSVQKYRTPLIPVCIFAKSVPDVCTMYLICIVWSHGNKDSRLVFFWCHFKMLRFSPFIMLWITFKVTLRQYDLL